MGDLAVLPRGRPSIRATLRKRAPRGCSSGRYIPTGRTAAPPYRNRPAAIRFPNPHWWSRPPARSFRTGWEAFCFPCGARSDFGHQFVYRLDEGGAVVYKLALPEYQGTLHDGMVLGEDERGYASRGNLLIAFNVRKGKELWRWEASSPEIEVFAALANGGCAVQTATALVEVDNAATAKELAKGKAMMDWQGHMYIKHN